MMEFNIIMN